MRCDDDLGRLTGTTSRAVAVVGQVNETAVLRKPLPFALHLVSDDVRRVVQRLGIHRRIKMERRHAPARGDCS